MSQAKKQNFLQGASILAAAVVIVKIIGAFYKIPLRMIIGDEGYGYFTTAYDIYSIFLTISTAGLPLAMSRMITLEYSLEHYRSMRRVYKVSQTIFFILGLTCTILMLAFSGPLAQSLKQPRAVPAIICLAPCALLMCTISPLRGYFQGQENMVPTSTSQVLEAAIKLVVGLALAWAVDHFTGNKALAAGAAILGVTASCAGSVIFLFCKFRSAWKTLPSQSDEELPTVGKTIKNLFAIAIPITIGSAGLYILNVIEAGVYMDKLVDLIASGRYDLPLVESLKTSILAEDPSIAAADLHSRVATTLKGIYNFGQTIFNMPVSLIAPISISVMPALTAQLTLKNSQQVRSIEESSARITGLLSFPCCVGLCLLAGPVMSLLGRYGTDAQGLMKLELGTTLLFLLSAGIIANSLIMYTNVTLQSYGKFNIPVINTVLVACVRLPLVGYMTGNPALGIIGIPLTGLLSNTAIVVLNLIALRFVATEKPKLLRNFFRAAIPAAVMGVAVYGVRLGLEALLSSVGSATLSAALICAGGIAVGVVVYVLAVVVCKVITYEDCLLLPKGEKLAKVLKL